MKTYILWAFVGVLLLSAGPALCQDNDDDKFAQPQIDVISDVETVEVPSPKTPKEKGQKRHPEDRQPASQQAPSGLDTPSPTLHEVDKSEASDVESPQAGKKPNNKKPTEESGSGRDVASEPVVEISDSEKPSPVEVAPEEQVEVKPEPVEIQQEQAEVKPEPVQEPVVQPPKPAEVQKEAPKNENQGSKGQATPAKPPVKEQPAQPVPQAQEQKPPVPEQPVKVEEPVKPTEVPEVKPEVVKPQNVQEKPPVSPPEPQKQAPTQPVNQQVPKPEVPPVKPADVKPAPVKEEPGKKDKAPVHPEFDEEQYLNLYENEGNNYLDQYTVYSDTFYTHVERFIKEAVVPIYHHIRSNPELSLGFSTLIVMYFIHLFFRILGRIFRRKPKFVYNKEEALSHADINNNFKKFVAELDSLKKQIDKKGGSVVQASGETTSTASIPQNLQNEISYIAQNLSKNEELLGKITKDRKQLDSFLFEFQKEVVESHKAIWNELYQLRKVFSQTKTSTSSLKPREAKDLDDTKSLSSNPETSETRRRDDQRDSAKKGTEPRSRSAAGPETNALRSRQPLPKEKKPVQVAEPEKPASGLQNGNGTETHAAPHVHKEEESEPKPHATQTPFGKQEVTEEEAQPEVQINANLSDKAPSHNPFAASTQINQNTTSTITPNVNIPAKGIPFGVKGRAPVVKQPVIQTTFPLGNEPPAVNSGAKVEPTEVNSGLKATTPALLQNNMPPHHPAQSQVETQEKSEEKSTVPETDQAQEEAKAPERLSGVDEMLAGGEEEGSDANTGSRGLIPPMRGPGPMGMGGPPGQRKPMIPTNKALPVPGRKPGLPGANVFKGPPGNIPRAAVPTQLKQPQGQVQDAAPKTGTAV